MSTDQLKLDIHTIISVKRQMVQQRQDKTPASAVIALATMQRHPRPVLGVVTEGEHIALIGQIRFEELYDPVGAALRYVRYGVDAISLFTDDNIYSKGMDDLSLVARGVNAPIICQDYVVNEYQVAEARAAGASGLVLYGSLLNQTDLRRVVSITQRWRMTSIIEVANEGEMAHAAQLSPHVIGIGLRHIFDRKRDLDRLYRLKALAPYNTRLIALGCLQTLEDVAAVLDVGVDAIIVDETLLNAPAKYETLRHMLNR